MPMPDRYEREHTVWVIQYPGRRGWFSVPSLARTTRREAIALWREIWADGDGGWKRWRREREAGRVRCAKARLLVMEGFDA